MKIFECDSCVMPRTAADRPAEILLINHRELKLENLISDGNLLTLGNIIDYRASSKLLVLQCGWLASTVYLLIIDSFSTIRAPLHNKYFDTKSKYKVKNVLYLVIVSISFSCSSMDNGQFVRQIQQNVTFLEPGDSEAGGDKSHTGTRQPKRHGFIFWKILLKQFCAATVNEDPAV